MAQGLGEFLLALDGSSLPDRQLIGGKAWSIARMKSLGLAVPPAFVVTARNYDVFADAILRKLVAEISEKQPEPAAPKFALRLK